MIMRKIQNKIEKKGHGFIVNVMTNKLICCEFKGKQASKIESTSLFCISYTVLHVRYQKNE